jgi:hypothetical protein
MRMFLFMLSFRLTWWIAPNKKRVDQLFDMYLKLLDMEEQKKKCENMQKEKDSCVRPRTEIHEKTNLHIQR